MRNLILASAAAATVATGIGVSFSTPAFAQAGSYQRTCRNYNSSGGSLTAECADAQGRYHSSTLNTSQCRGDISNQNGMLSCPGGQASGGQLVGGGQQGPQGRNDQRFGQGSGDQRFGQGGGDQRFGQGRGDQRFDQGRNDRRDERDDRRDDRTGAAIAGAIAGALLGANGQPVAPPPAFGDPRYGDPRYDYRYQQGWWGYGHRPGEWVRIRDRADWLDRRIDRGLREGRIDRRTARDLRRELAFIEDQEDRFLRDGRLGPRERADLDRRFDDLSQRIRFESGPRGGYRDRDRF